MYQPIQKRAKIYSTGIHLPTEIVKSDDLFAEINSETQYDIPINWMSEKMGIIERRVAPSDAKPSDLAIPAAKQAIDEATNVNPEDIDLVIFCGIERDQPEPATAHTIQNKLGLNARYAFDIANACFGFVDAMQIATNYISCGIVKHALVVTGEVPTRVMNAAISRLKQGVDIKTARNIIGALSVGDAGGAVILGSADNDENSGFKLFNTISQSHLSEKCKYTKRNDGTIEGHMMMGQITGAFIRSQYNLIDETLEKLGWDSFDWTLTHQIGQRPFERLSNMNGVKSGKMIKTLHKLGNITSATFPINFKELTNTTKIKKGDKVGGCFAGSGLVVGQFGYVF